MIQNKDELDGPGSNGEDHSVEVKKQEEEEKELNEINDSALKSLEENCWR